MKKYLFLLLGFVFSSFSHAAVTYLHVDVAGNVVAESNTSGAVTKKIYYEPFGRQLDSSNNDEPGYSSHFFDADLNLVYMQARYYDPLIGRFYSDDPAAFQKDNAHSFNRYIYANNNPYKFKDPDGKIPLLIPVAIFIAKEIAAELASNATGGATDFLSMRRVGAHAGRFAVNKMSAAVSKANNEISKSTTNKAQNLQQRAADLAKRNGGNSVTIKHKDGQVRVDLAGAAHHSKDVGKSIETPHVQDYKNNVIPNGPRQGEVGSISKNGDVRAADKDDLRMVDRYLRSQGE